VGLVARGNLMAVKAMEGVVLEGVTE